MLLTQDVNIEYLLYRILLGYYNITFNNLDCVVYYPSLNIKYKAEQLYLKVLDDHKFDTEWLSDIQLQILLEKNNIWNNEKDNYLKNQQNLLDKTKIELYKDFSNQQLKNKHKKLISSINSIVNNLITEKTSLDYLTLDFFASTIKHEYILMNTTYYNERLLLKDNDDHKLVQDLSYEILKHQINMTTLKQIARSDLWKSYYSENVMYPNGTLETNDDYRNLINLSKMYDSIKQHPEAPTEEVTNDDDALDGWLLLQKEKATKDKRKNQVLDRIRGNKIKDAKELFVITQDQKEAEEIFGLNDPKTMKDIRASIDMAKQKGKVSWTDLDHVIEEKLMEQGKGGYNKIKENLK